MFGQLSQISLVLGGLGFRSPKRKVRCFFFCSWCMLEHPDVGTQLTLHLESLAHTCCLSEVAGHPP